MTCQHWSSEWPCWCDLTSSCWCGLTSSHHLIIAPRSRDVIRHAQGPALILKLIQNHRQISNIKGTLGGRGQKMLITQIKLEYHLSALLQLYFHAPLDTWLWITCAYHLFAWIDCSFHFHASFCLWLYSTNIWASMTTTYSCLVAINVPGVFHFYCVIPVLFSKYS